MRPIKERPTKGKVFAGWNNVVLLDAGKLSRISGRPKSKFLRPLSEKMRAEAEKNWALRTARQKAEGKRVWDSNPLIRPGDPFASRRHPGKVFIPVEQAGLGYKEHLEGYEGKVIRRERMKHPIKRARSLPYAIGLDVMTIIKTPDGKRFLYMQKRSMQVQSYKGWMHFQPAKYPVAKRESEKKPFPSLRKQILAAAEVEVGIPAERITFLGQGLKPAGGKKTPGIVIRTPAKGHSQVNIFPLLEVKATQAELEGFQKKAEHSWESAGGPVLVELAPQKLNAFFKKHKAIYPQAVKQLIKELKAEKKG